MEYESSAIFAGYVALKFAAYAAWCGFGARRFAPEGESPIARGIALGFVRLVLGLVFGVLIFLAGAALYGKLDETDLSPTVAMVLTYLAVYVPVRWIEWAIIEALLRKEACGLAAFLLGVDRAGRAWRLGGALVSCLADIPIMLAAGGLPVGRFMC